MKAFTLVNPDWAVSEIDIIINSPLNYTDAIKRPNVLKLHGISIPVISQKDLIKMKRNTGRKQDTIDIKNLMEVMSGEK